MKCALCKGRMEKKNITLPYEINKESLLVIRGVPALVCRQCGDSFVEIEIVRELEIIVENSRENGVTLGFIEYRQAA